MPKKVTFHYTIFSEKGAILDSNQDNKPITIELGKGQFISFVEQTLLDAKDGDNIELSIPPEKGFGAHKPEMVKETSKSNLPSQLQQLGTLVELVDDAGQQRNARVVAASDETVTLDFNHPFAGQTVICSINVVKVTSPAEVPA